MSEIRPETSLQQLAVLISEALEQAAIVATLSGGGAVSIYTENRYQSHDLDFVIRCAPSADRRRRGTGLHSIQLQAAV